MSIQFNWDALKEDHEHIEKQVCDFLNTQFQSITLPGFISSLAVSGFTLGSSPPEVVLKHFSDPFPEFYNLQNDSDSHLSNSDSGGDMDTRIEYDKKKISTSSPLISPHNPPLSSPSTPSQSMLNYRLVDDSDEEETGEEDRSPLDVQTYVELKYDSDMQIAVSATLLVNYPAPSFVSLPLKIKVSCINIHALVAVACIGTRVHITVMSDVHDKDVVPAEQVDVIKSMKIESEIGDSSDGAMLRNVGKAEAFVIEQLRNVIRDELVWPGWLTLEF